MGEVVYRLVIVPGGTMDRAFMVTTRTFPGAKRVAGHVGRFAGSTITGPNGRKWVLTATDGGDLKWTEEGADA